MARNYLQSPYFFMCCSLCDAAHDPPAQYASQTALAGTMASSLHRLKDVDNTGTVFYEHWEVVDLLMRWSRCGLLCFWRSFCENRGRISSPIQSIRDVQVSHRDITGINNKRRALRLISM